jgi:hypothetical protein
MAALHYLITALQYLAVNNQQTTGTKIVCFDTAGGTNEQA